jgi:hypothetical protein
MAGLVPAISLRDARCPPHRDRRDKPGDDSGEFVAPRDLLSIMLPLELTAASASAARKLECLS